MNTCAQGSFTGLLEQGSSSSVCGGKKCDGFKKKKSYFITMRFPGPDYRVLSPFPLTAERQICRWQVNRKWISTQKQKRGCPRHVQNQHNPSDTQGSTTLITYKEARKISRHQVWNAQATYFCPAVTTSGFSLTLNAGEGRSSVPLPLSLLKNNITQVLWDFEAPLGKHPGIKQLQTLTAPFFSHKMLTSISFFLFFFLVSFWLCMAVGYFRFINCWT